MAVVIFGVPFGWFGGPRRRAWYQERLDRAAPVPYGATVVAREDAFEAVSRPLTVPLLTGLIVGLFIAFGTGVPAGLALAGVGGGMLSQAQWLAGEERRLGTFLLCPQAPLRVEANDPALSVYRQVPFYTAPEKTAADQD
ncbi:hypothetical protein [Actinacidiphila soli]|uniref:hypothetical protein n=1 Tax=Actinacidiphila soli TaxID=2487275 RepID=UPI000FCA4005|nr:hypothetical protein [Actinacidiphila soli]